MLAGAFMMLSKKAIELTKGFDEAFFMYGEDIDLSYGVTKAGWQNYYLGETTIIHFKGESTHTKDAAYIKHFYGAMQLFVDKYYKNSHLKYSAMSVAIILSKIIAIIKSSFYKNNKSILRIAPMLTLFIGEKQQYEKANDILKNSTYSLAFFLNYLNDYKIDKIKKIISEKKIEAIIFGESQNFLNLGIIQTLSLLPTCCNFLFYESGADSIIGSNKKNDRGEFISNF